ncbi:uncharacterized protein LOC100843732 [Brachypodium distachyon]|uniref:Uncharacterized protein n=1 Tax=Brachypodium distachyon TaxID=15368 RepID=I1IVN8_BRADI|nr:uncharacterized protein LOC100843732 [Brachypodium distachyon]XP_010239636.1 uncharacterized protein LOC100843732 [Brachypodium distachyon]XP_010239637.1 uncharacterized protein LOC100843732 [Brachypodium distachyon]KQJ81534.1 hypothetical protein BRADI_5g01310v3 [Brachypodium distachyon]KQJ81535.1 hypothetical protein BRADI_5g01310v3 [Brachypodium distachyon]KQJ81536.1 hypothetical protein BRADI_5g01310v3 [Brachypodium distachyon]|eukprot:XP_003580224.1 uncharacterized protein LOC100843732 [Brachypodium distachyon]
MPNGENKLFKMPNADGEISALHKEWDDARCPICMDHPHNAVLLLCSSHDKGCRSYICDTSYRHSNCLDRFKKMKLDHMDSSSQPSSSFPRDPSNRNVAQISRVGLNRESPRLLIDIPDRGDLGHQHVIHSSAAIAGQQEETNFIQDTDLTLVAQEGEGSRLVESGEAANLNQLMCPVCRGTVEGWEIIKDARQYLDEKPRACSREACTFSGNYSALRRHARRVHPTTRPADVDPSRRRAWHRLEHQREYGDILSAIRSAMPGAVVLGDYVIEGGDMSSHDREGSGPNQPSGSLLTTFFLFHMMSTTPMRSGDEPRGSSRGLRRQRRRYLWGENLLGLQYDDDDDEEGDDNLAEEVQRPRSHRRFVRSRSEERH